MTCSSCLNQIPPDAHFCSHCGTSLSDAAAHAYQPAYFVPAMPGRVARHIQALGILWLMYAIWRTLIRFAGLAFLQGMFGWRHHFGWGPWEHFGVWPFALSSLVFGMVLSLLTAYALSTRQPWGRVLGIISGIFALVHPVLGTALGIYTLWVLAPAASGVEYAHLSARNVRIRSSLSFNVRGER